MAPILAYWNLRGLAQPIRLLLEYLGTPYEEKKFGSEERDLWLKEKFNLNLDFPNLPYYIDGDVRLTQSLAILRYIADKHNLLGKTPEERAKLSMLEGVVLDVRIGLSKISYDKNFETLKVDFMANLPNHLKIWSDYLGEKLYFNGEAVSHPDFLFYETLDALTYLDRNCLTPFPNLLAFKSRIEALPNIKAYMESDRFIKWPLNGWSAYFGGGTAPPTA